MFELPWPQTISEIKSLMKAKKSQYPDYFSGDRYHVENLAIVELSKLGYWEKKIDCQMITKSSELFDAYSIYRSFNQLNEACNKFWATVELANVVSPAAWKKSYTPLGEKFDRSFLGGTLIPGLYYSHVSSLISILSLFGCVSLYDDEVNVPYNLVRTKDGWYIVERGEYLKRVFGITVKGWHSQIIELVRGFSSKIPDFPKIDVDKTRKLRDLRNTTHYEILSAVSTKPVKETTEKFFDFLPLVAETILKGFSVMKQVCDSEIDLPLSTLGNRMRDLFLKLPDLYKNYGKEYSEFFGEDGSSWI